MATLAELVLRIEDKLYGMAEVERPKEDTVAAAALVGATSVDVTTPNMWKRDRILEVAPVNGAVGEVMMLASDPSGSTVTVRRGIRDTTPAALAGGEPIRLNPKYTRRMIEREIEEVIRTKLWPRVWYRTERTLSYADGTDVYELNADDADVLQMYQYDIDSDGQFYEFPSGWWRHRPQAAEAISSTNKVLEVRKVQSLADTVYYTARTIPKYTNLGDFPDTLADLVVWAACGQILGGVRTAPPRYDSNRQALPDVQEGGPARDWRYFENMFQLKIDEEHRRLRYEEREYRQPRYQRSRTRIRSWMT